MVLGAGLLCQTQAADRYVAQNGQMPVADFTSWATAASNIQDAVNAATAGDTVWLGTGRYTLPGNATNYVGPNVVYVNKPLTIQGASGNPADVVIDGEGVNRGMAVAYASPILGVTIDALTFSNGFATNRGGGVLLGGGAWTSLVQNCVFIGNMVTGAVDGACRGGGFYSFVNDHFYLLFSNCTFRGNRAAGDYGEGGGAYLGVGQSHLTAGASLYACLFEGNAAARGGGFNLGQVGTRGYNVYNSTVRGNVTQRSTGSASHGGGGIHHWPGKLSLWNSLICNNWDPINTGGGIYCQKAPGGLYVYNCTIVSNSAKSSYNYGGGIATRATNDFVVIHNSIVVSNTLMDIYLTSTYGSEFVNSCIGTNTMGGAGTYAATNVITDNPRFVNLAGQDFHLTKESPCINAGTNEPWMATALDLDGFPRISPRAGGTVDMGAYEFPIQYGSIFSVR